MDEALFHTILRNIGLFITLSFACLTYVYNFPKVYIRKLILSLGIIFLSISMLLNIRVMDVNGEINSSLQKIPKLLIIVQLILFMYIINLLIFKKMK